ncbi:glycosyltransferase involved in cell wall biosynthesis [Curtobacterium sp. PhB137]|uniref:glycosyltransferase family 2 protein n=1 Tax=Curtobacterium sp. PhB137 TaxID=2485182 RepID=UPI000F4FACF6|nr:glycosyltransferase [Curtobacterium sp. PhB137]RPE85243.1 glycosyltransferase involved in cell wall biosynthesis [Curtobacterium sp. PhB137]
MELSVLIPARNAAETIERSVLSTLRALPDDSEVVVLDDGSIDDTSERARGVKDRRLRVITSDSGSGVAAALNRLVDESSSRLIARMDADDVALPGRFKTQIAALSRSVDIVFGGVIHFGSKLRYPYPSPPFAISPAAFPIALLIENPVAHSTMVASRAVITDLGGYRECLAEDYDLWMRAAASGFRLSRLSNPVLGLRRHNGQVTADGSWAERAAVEPEWQESYASLAAEQGLIDDTPATRLRLRSETSLRSKRFLIQPELSAAVRHLNVRDRIALAFLRRRAERQ